MSGRSNGRMSRQPREQPNPIFTAITNFIAASNNKLKLDDYYTYHTLQTNTTLRTQNEALGIPEENTPGRKNLINEYYNHKNIAIPAAPPAAATDRGDGASSFTAAPAASVSPGILTEEEETALTKATEARPNDIYYIPYDHFKNGISNCFPIDINGMRFSKPLFVVGLSDKIQQPNDLETPATDKTRKKLSFYTIPGINYPNCKAEKKIPYFMYEYDLNHEEDEIRQNILRNLKDIHNAAKAGDINKYNNLIKKLICKKIPLESRAIVLPDENLTQEMKDYRKFHKFMDKKKDFKHLDWEYIIDTQSDMNPLIPREYSSSTIKLLASYKNTTESMFNNFKNYYWDENTTGNNAHSHAVIDFTVEGTINNYKINSINTSLKHYTIIAGHYKSGKGWMGGPIYSYLFGNNLVTAKGAVDPILVKIFGDSNNNNNYKSIRNVGVKGLEEEILKQRGRTISCIGKIFDDNAEIGDNKLSNIEEQPETKYNISKVNNDLSFIDNLDVSNKSLYMNINNSNYIFISNINFIIKEFLEKIVPDTGTTKFVSILDTCTSNHQENQQLEQKLKEIINCFTNSFVNDIFCGMNQQDLDDMDKIKLITDLKCGGDRITAQAAKALNCVFLTTDANAALYAIHIGCKTVFQKKPIATDNYIIHYYIFNPTPQPQPPAPVTTSPAPAAALVAPPPKYDEMGEPPAAQGTKRKAASPTQSLKGVPHVEESKDKEGNKFYRVYGEYGELFTTYDISTVLDMVTTLAQSKKQKHGQGQGQGGGGERKMKGGKISNEKFMNIAIEYIYERSLEGPRDYLRELIDYINNLQTEKDQPKTTEFKIDQKLVEHMNDYLKNKHITKYGYSTPLQYTVLRFLELSNVSFEGSPFTMERYATWIRKNAEKYLKKQEKQADSSPLIIPKRPASERPASSRRSVSERSVSSYRALSERPASSPRPASKSNRPTYLTSLRTESSIPVRNPLVFPYSVQTGITAGVGGNPNKNATALDEYEKKLASLYKKYIKLAESNKTEQELSKEFEKLDMGIQKLSAKIKKTMEKEIKK